MDIVKWNDVNDFILDGEVVFVDCEEMSGKYLNFQDMDRRQQSKTNEHFVEIGQPIRAPKLLVFDILALNGQSLTEMPLKYRKKIIAKRLNIRGVV